MIKTYKELSKFKTFLERYEYLKLNGTIGVDTFGFDRYLNQRFYRSSKWKSIRNEIIIRDNGCDLGIEDYELHGRILIHHMNPLLPQDIIDQTEFLLNPDYLIATSLATHNAIHYGDESLLPKLPVERSRNDMCPWKK